MNLLPKQAQTKAESLYAVNTILPQLFNQTFSLGVLGTQKLRLRKVGPCRYHFTKRINFFFGGGVVVLITAEKATKNNCSHLNNRKNALITLWFKWEKIHCRDSIPLYRIDSKILLSRYLIVDYNVYRCCGSIKLMQIMLFLPEHGIWNNSLFKMYFFSRWR